LKRFFANLLQVYGGSQQKIRNQWVVFVISFILAFTFWFLVNLNQTYQTVLALPAKIEGVPEDLQLFPIVFPEVEIQVKGTGVSIMAYIFKFQRDTLRFRYRPGTQENFLLTQPYINSLKNSISGVELLAISSPDTLSFDIERKVAKRVPIIPKVKVRLAQAHLLEKPYTIYPDSVRIVGPEKMLDSINSWSTYEVTTPILGEETVFPLPVIDSIKKLLVEPRTIYLQVNPQLYTHTSIKVPLLVANLPEDTYVNFQHAELEVSCLVPMNKYEELHNTTYSYTIPYDSIDKSLPYLLPQYDFFPEGVKVLYSEPARISYVVVYQ